MQTNGEFDDECNVEFISVLLGRAKAREKYPALLPGRPLDGPGARSWMFYVHRVTSPITNRCKKRMTRVDGETLGEN